MYSQVHVIGDSHVLLLDRIFVTHHIAEAETLQGATAHNLISPKSATQSKQRIKAVLETLDPEHDTVLMLFGEVDCRLHVRTEKQIAATIERYGKAIEGVVAKGFRVVVHAVIGAVPQDNIWRQADYPDIEIRGGIVNRFNALLSEWCEKHDVEFLDIPVRDERGVLLANLCDDGVHLNDRAFPLYREWATGADLGETVENFVWCTGGMEHFGQIVSKALGWMLFVDVPVPDCDTVYIVGLYDPPTYNYTMEHTKRAKRRIIHWCGSDVSALSMVSMLPEATHIAESEGLLRELYSKGIDSTWITFPTGISPEVTPYPEKPTVAVYFGTNQSKYGMQQILMLQDVFPDVAWNTYTYGQYTSEQMPDVISKASVYLRLIEHDGSATSAREYMAAGRKCICTVDMPYATVVRHDDFEGIIIALSRALRETEPDYEAAAYYHEFNSVERYLADVEAVL